MKSSPETGPLICHINLAKGFRGGERQTELLIRDLAGRGWHQRLVARPAAELARRCAGVDQLEIVEVPSNPVSAAFAARGSALVHAHEARSVYSGWLASLAAGIPYVLTRRVDTAFKSSSLRGFAYRRADQVVCLSETIVRRVRGEYPSINCRVVPSAHAALANGAHDPNRIRDRFPGKTIVGHIGALIQRHKGQRTIIAAARDAVTSMPDLHFLLVGGGEDEQALLQEAAGLPNLQLMGHVENVADYLAAFDIFIFPSLYEGLGSSLLDAMSFGLPLVASDVGGIAELVEDGVNGILIPPNDADALGRALSELCNDPAMRQAMRTANLRKAAQFGADRMGAAYEGIYRTVLGQRRADAVNT